MSIVDAELFEEGQGEFLNSKDNIFSLKIGRKYYHIQAANDVEKRSWLSALSYNMAQSNAASPKRMSLFRCAWVSAVRLLFIVSMLYLRPCVYTVSPLSASFPYVSPLCKWIGRICVFSTVVYLLVHC